MMFIVMYMIIALITWLLLMILVNLNRGVDREFDEATSDSGVVMVTTLVASIFWFVTLAFIIYNNFIRRND